MREPGRKIILDSAVEVVHLRAHVHGDLALGGAVGEEQGVLVGGGDGVGLGEGGVGGRGEVAEGE